MSDHDYGPPTGLAATLGATFLVLVAASTNALAFSSVVPAVHIDGYAHSLHRTNVFSDDPQILHDPRYEQPQTGANRMFAPIGTVRVNHRLLSPDASKISSYFSVGTAFLVSPCYLMTDYHVIFGHESDELDNDRDYSATFFVLGKKVRAMPVIHGAFQRYSGGDWVLLRLDRDADNRCLGQEVGWTELAPLRPDELAAKTLSIAGYPSDESGSFLWRQDGCHLIEQETESEERGVWMTNCATQPRASGSPIFFIRDGVLNVVALMHGHLGKERPREILPHWDPNRANLAVDVEEIVSSHPELLELLRSDIQRFMTPNPAQIGLNDAQERHFTGKFKAGPRHSR